MLLQKNSIMKSWTPALTGLVIDAVGVLIQMKHTKYA
jgi:hypothetical protein